MEEKGYIYKILPKEMPTREMLASIPKEKLAEIRPVVGEVELYAKFSNQYNRTFKTAKANQTFWDMLTKYRHVILRVERYSIKFTLGCNRQIKVVFILPERTYKQQEMQIAKIGSLDNSGTMRYVTKEEAELLTIFMENTDIPEKLIDFSTFWRFPWPDEDVNISYLMELEPFYQELIKQIPNRTINRSLSFNAKLKLDNHNDCSTSFSILGEKHSREGRRTIISCDSCQRLSSLSPSNLALAKEGILSLTNQEPLFLLQVAARLKASQQLFLSY